MSNDDSAEFSPKPSGSKDHASRLSVLEIAQATNREKIKNAKEIVDEIKMSLQSVLDENTLRDKGHARMDTDIQQNKKDIQTLFKLLDTCLNKDTLKTEMKHNEVLYDAKINNVKEVFQLKLDGNSTAISAHKQDMEEHEKSMAFKIKIWITISTLMGSGIGYFIGVLTN